MVEKYLLIEKDPEDKKDGCLGDSEVDLVERKNQDN